jgi:hypothetical protein
MPAIARAEKADTTELEVVPFDLKVVVHTTKVVSFDRAADANARVTPLLALVSCRTFARQTHSIEWKHHRGFRATRTAPRMSRFNRCRCEIAAGAFDPVAWRHDSMPGARKTFAGHRTVPADDRAPIRGPQFSPRRAPLRCQADAIASRAHAIASSVRAFAEGVPTFGSSEGAIALGKHPLEADRTQSRSVADGSVCLLARAPLHAPVYDCRTTALDRRQTGARFNLRSVG